LYALLFLCYWFEWPLRSVGRGSWSTETETVITSTFAWWQQMATLSISWLSLRMHVFEREFMCGYAMHCHVSRFASATQKIKLWDFVGVLMHPYIHTSMYLRKSCAAHVYIESCEWRDPALWEPSHMWLHVNGMHLTCNTQSSINRINWTRAAAWLLNMQNRHSSHPRLSSTSAHRTFDHFFTQLKSNRAMTGFMPWTSDMPYVSACPVLNANHAAKFETVVKFYYKLIKIYPFCEIIVFLNLQTWSKRALTTNQPKSVPKRRFHMRKWIAARSTVKI